MKKLLSLAILASLALVACGNEKAETPQNEDLQKAEAKIEALKKEIAQVKDENTVLKEDNAKIAASKEKLEAETQTKEQSSVTETPKQETKETPIAPKTMQPEVEEKATEPAKETSAITGREKGQLIAAQKKKLNNPNLTQSERESIIAEIKRLGQLPVSH
ncbi:hypothetical protein BMT55_07070 [Listeria newyorkensis]|uniref:Lipoprotein n=1 Tax=Listeria newyorkensis TaxID=1497681 RepID=A0ABX4XQ05_9LIST|nr:MULTISPECIES: hypothetical protein [Listeria]KGL42312.1 hypothetical protein EP56_08840 [Listeriaceae bacterium FSL A5-0209]KGL38742.1 hypothetical protein EP58_15015 [Listeria newyorkensis]KMT62267.1 hypothetical protein X559_1429 [Listeria newyorkensis]PNP92714.1 hypothetical protein BMT55_07070 [Listeria newyorkensis]RQW66513.1 hypothetical protein DUK53_10315 [Listeria sp. SHR_NRA_18]